MYRIELSPGEETAFRSIEELAVAIRRKVVTSRARIYHNATSRWLPIQFHPHYQIALSMPLTQADLVAGPPVTPLSQLKLGEPQPGAPPQTPSTREAATQAALAAWPEPKPSASVQPLVQAPPQEIVAPPLPAPRPPVRPAAPEPPRGILEPRGASPVGRGVQVERRRGPARAPEHQRLVEPLRIAAPVRAEGSRRRRKPRRPLRVALAGAVLIACTHLAISSASPPASEPPARPRTPRQLITAPAAALTNATPRTVAAVMPVLQSIPVPGFRSSTSPAAAQATEPATLPNPANAEAILPAPAAANDSAAAAAPTLEAAPDAGAIVVGRPLVAESLAPQVLDSSGKKALKGILRTIGGSPQPKSRSSKR